MKMEMLSRHFVKLAWPSLSRCKAHISNQFCSATASGVQIRTMTPQEAIEVLPRASREGSGPAPYECQTISQFNPDGLFIAESNEGIVGSICAMKYSPKFGHIGFYHVEPQFRSKGIGHELWNTAVEYLGAECNISIDAPAEKTQVLQKLGFEVAWRHCRYKGRSTNLLPEVIDTKHVRSLARLSLAPMVDFDSDVCKVERRHFVQRWANTPKPGGAFAAVRDRDILGYGVVRPCIEGHMIGPLYALNTAITQPLLLTLSSLVPDKTIYIDALEENPSFIQLLSQDLQMEPVFESVRMYNKGDPGILRQKMFAISSVDTG